MSKKSGLEQNYMNTLKDPASQDKITRGAGAVNWTLMVKTDLHGGIMIGV